MLTVIHLQTCVTIRELEFAALKALVDFVYTGYLDVNVSNVQSLFQASNLLQIHCKFSIFSKVEHKVGDLTADILGHLIS